tara:strand:+ start:218 stop:661 length:444 start_codon:yes stop_codon:yes gene_type:complete
VRKGNAQVGKGEAKRRDELAVRVDRTAENLVDRQRTAVLRELVHDLSTVRQLYEVQPKAHVQRILLRVLHGERTPVSDGAMRVVPLETTPGEHTGARHERVDLPVQIVPQTVDTERVVGAGRKHHTKRTQREMETTSKHLGFKFKYN